ncbi:MAG: FGGY-family carbohydrate kinase, partial [Stenotrophomonas sp.]
YALKYGFDAFVGAGMRCDRIVLTGGGSNSAAWRQMVADVFGLPVEVPQQSEGAAFGAALQALWALQRSAATHVTPDAAATATPDGARSAAYALAYQRYLQHLHAVMPLYRG